MFFNIKISSKDKKTLKKFEIILNEVNYKTSCFTVKRLPLKTKKKFLTVLKSPHINKTAQEQFGYIIYSKRYVLLSLKQRFFVTYFKKLKSYLLPGIKVELEIVVDKNLSYAFLLKQINPEQKKLHFLNYCDLLDVKTYCQILDLYGEVSLRKIIL